MKNACARKNDAFYTKTVTPTHENIAHYNKLKAFTDKHVDKAHFCGKLKSVSDLCFNMGGASPHKLKLKDFSTIIYPSISNILIIFYW